MASCTRERGAATQSHTATQLHRTTELHIGPQCCHSISRSPISATKSRNVSQPQRQSQGKPKTHFTQNMQRVGQTAFRNHLISLLGISYEQHPSEMDFYKIVPHQPAQAMGWLREKSLMSILAACLYEDKSGAMASEQESQRTS